eukprot:5978062-Amphidinium_carterae.1
MNCDMELVVQVVHTKVTQLRTFHNVAVEAGIVLTELSLTCNCFKLSAGCSGYYTGTTQAAWECFGMGPCGLCGRGLSVLRLAMRSNWKLYYLRLNCRQRESGILIVLAPRHALQFGTP